MMARMASVIAIISSFTCFSWYLRKSDDEGQEKSKIERIERAKFIKGRAFILVSSLSATFLSAFGSAARLSWIMAFSMGSLALPIVVAAFDYTRSFTKKRWIIMLMAVVFSSYIGAFISVFKEFGHNSIMHDKDFGTVPIRSPYLKKIKIFKLTSNCIDKLCLTLATNGFDFEKDRIFAPYLAGFVSAIGAKSFGCLFQFYLSKDSRQDSFDKFSLAFLELEKGKDIRHVYILQSEKERIGKTVINYLGGVIEPCENMKKVLIGSGPRDNNVEYGARMFLVGPYKVRKK
ncbi:hypothetical protein HYD_1050 [Candidatus Hydrogenosomobacter endosymbioticus]|uniref:Uncharacterized protein n=2 Tax=Candidatus Hydrogenosomobacter endosymbioticus TaxID=2558174 RepID=A0ABN6L717_9PROT|nr:hypothetical protein HYD_1050 [Candidatus Hydrogenosomobacter endosymbioticus]